MSEPTDKNPSERDSKIEELVDEFVRARRSGDSVRLEDLVEANPQLEPELSDRLRFAESLIDIVHKTDVEETTLLPAIGCSARLRCPHCGNIVQVVEDSEEVTCGSCGSSISQEEEATRSYSPSSAQIAHFELVERVGRGGFGVVYRALDTRLQRHVALKIPRRGYFGTKDEEARFLREARSAANLKHPNIVQVHEVGTERDSHYIATEFIDGLNLAEVIKGQMLSFRQTAGCLEKIGSALHYAHEHGVIHRDVKPANILLDANEQPYLTDFGLARDSEPAITVTRDGEVLGTPAYMSPEQAAAENSKLDRRSDVYSLGVTLFRMLSGELPFRGSRRMLLNKVMNDDPPTVRSLNETVPRDLETIALRAMEKVPEKRYQTAQEFSDELHRWLAGDPILARPISSVERVWRWCRKRPLISSLLATILLLLCSISVGALVWGVRENRLKEVAEASDVESRERLASAFASAASELLLDDNSLAAVPHSVEALAVQEALGSDQANLTRIQLETTLANSPRLVHLTDVGGSINDIVLQPDGQGFLVSSGSMIRRYDMEWRELGPSLKTKHPIRSVAINSTGDRIFGLQFAGFVTVWDADGKQIAEIAQPGLVDARFSPDGKLIATAGGDTKAEVRVWSATDGGLKETLAQAGETTYLVRFSPDSKKLASLSTGLIDPGEIEFSLSIWTLANQEEVKVPISKDDYHRFVFQDDQNLLTVAESGLIHRYNTDGTREEDFRLQGEPPASLTYTLFNQGPISLVGPHHLATRRNGSVRIWNLNSGQIALGPIAHGGQIDEHGLTLSPDHAMFAMAGEHNRVNVHWATTGERVGPAIGHSTPVDAVQFLSDTLMATGTNSGVLKIWDLSGITRGSSILKHDAQVWEARFSPDSQRIATTTNDGSQPGKSAVWSRNTTQRISEVEHSAPAMVTAFSPDGRTVVSSGFDGGLIVRDALGVNDRKDVIQDSDWANEIVFSGTKKNTFATSNMAGGIRIWEVGSTEPIQTFQHSKMIKSLDFHSTRNLLASCSGDESARVWNIESGKPEGAPLRDQGAMSWCRFSPDGSLLGTCGQSGNIILWDWQSGKAKTKLASAGRQRMFDFNPDGSQICSAFNSAFAQVWNVADRTQPRWSFPHPQINTADWHPSLPLVVATGGRTGKSNRAFARIWDASSGLPLSPKLPHAADTWGAFSPDGTAILTHSEDTTARVWSIRPTTHDIETLRALAIVLSGTAMRDRRLVPVPAADQAQVFAKLRDRLPVEFTRSSEERDRFKTLRQLREQAEQ